MTRKQLQKQISNKLGNKFIIDDSTTFTGFEHKYCIRIGTDVISRFNTLDEGVEFINTL